MSDTPKARPGNAPSPEEGSDALPIGTRLAEFEMRQIRKALPASAFDDAWLRALIDPLLGALEVMHDADVYHRDIAPDNILWCDDGRPVLLDFGAARLVLADRTQNVTAILKPQFAPIEQYPEAPLLRQGPWTDLYALAGTCYFMLTRRAPLP